MKYYKISYSKIDEEIIYMLLCCDENPMAAFVKAKEKISHHLETMDWYLRDIKRIK